MHVCTRCGNELFDNDKAFDAGCGFPSFWMAQSEQVKEVFLSTYGRERTQLVCGQCGQHLGHLFTSKVTPTGKRYCIMAEAIRLIS